MLNDGLTHQPIKETDVNINVSEKIITKDEQTDHEKISRYRRALPQVLASTAKNLILMDLGMTIAFPTIVIPALTNNKTGEGMYFDSSEASWFGSIAFICQPVGSILSGILLEPLGRKCSLLLVNFPHILGWLLFYFASTVRTIFIANIIMGLGVGFMEAPIITYVGEICEPRLRGILISYSSLFFSFGLVVITSLGNLTDWQTTALISTLVPIITVIAITQVPETPYWLLSRGRYSDAEKSLCWLRGWVKPHVIQQEFQEMVRYSALSKFNKNNVQNEKENKSAVAFSNPVSLDDEKVSNQNNGTETIKKDDSTINTSKTIEQEKISGEEFVSVELPQRADGITGNDKMKDNANNNKIKNTKTEEHCDKMNFIEHCKDLTRPEMLKPLTLVIGFFFVINFAGVTAIRPYQIKVFQELGFPINAYRAIVVMSVNSFVATVLCMILVKFLGKRPLTLISLFINSAAIYTLSVYAVLHDSGKEGNESEKNWFPFITYFILQFFFSFGVSPVPWMLVSEVFPYRGRSQASGFAAGCSYILSFAATKTFLGFEAALSLSGVLFLYGTCSLIGLITMYIYMPETEGRSFEEIEDTYSSVKKKGVDT
ncbi:facilitated trehalose transporter Tret1-like [Lycorma delicatula]|uniref:facilitated trehalose transporter Tret1-like n=1 Tax=Lycorma delicatula TaxID=130591 RepID=UPI003F50EA49